MRTCTVPGKASEPCMSASRQRSIRGGASLPRLADFVRTELQDAFEHELRIAAEGRRRAALPARRHAEAHRQCRMGMGPRIRMIKQREETAMREIVALRQVLWRLNRS